MNAEERMQLCSEVCARVLRGDTLKAIFDTEQITEDCPGNRISWGGFNKWRREDTELNALFLDALRERQTLEVQSILEIADNESLSPESRRVRIAARQWLAERLNATMYGNRVQVDQNVNITIGREIEARLQRAYKRLAAVA